MCMLNAYGGTSILLICLIKMHTCSQDLLMSWLVKWSLGWKLTWEENGGPGHMLDCEFTDPQETKEANRMCSGEGYPEHKAVRHATSESHRPLQRGSIQPLQNVTVSLAVIWTWGAYTPYGQFQHWVPGGIPGNGADKRSHPHTHWSASKACL